MKYPLTISLIIFFIVGSICSVVAFSTIPVASNYANSKQTYSDIVGKKQILVLHSYHADMPWVQSIEQGIQSVLGLNQQVSLYVDYMDTKRNISTDYLDTLYELYLHKYKDKRFDAIIVTDDAAYQFALKHQQHLFPGTPIVFCGVNFFDPAQLATNWWVTGIIEAVDVKSTLQLIVQLQPQVTHIVVINDATVIGKVNKQLLQETMPAFADKLTFSFSEDMSMAEILAQVAALGDDTAILLMTFNVDKYQTIFSYEESSDLISSHSHVPIYGTWDFYLGHGMVGGMMTSGYNHGRAAAEMVDKIVFGALPPVMLPVATENINQYMFDYNSLTKAHFREDALPKGSIIINKPVTFYESYKFLVWFVAFVFLLLLALVVILTINIRHRKYAQEETRQLNAELETRVSERTNELSQTNNRLKATLMALQETRNHLVQTEKMASLGELVAGVAHEINTPIGNSITAISHLDLKSGEFSEKFSSGQLKKSDLLAYSDLCQNVVKITSTNLERAAELIRSFKKIAVDQSVEERQLFNLHEYLQDVLLSLKPQLKKAQHQIILNCPEHLKVYCHPGSLWQLLSNLLNNSLLHAYPEDQVGTISIDISYDDNAIQLKYHDDGAGMSAEIQKKIFEPFFTTRRGTGGSGLGMYIVYNLVVFKMNGTIECISDVGIGTTFTIKLPDTIQKQGGHLNG